MATAEFQWGDEEFDDSFFQEVDRLEELATSLTQNRHPLKPSVSSASAATVSLHPPPPTPVQLPPPPQPLISGAPFVNVSYSPPRELSQRSRLLNDSNDSNPSSSNRSAQSPVVQEQPEIERLKTELSQVSKQLSDLKQECFELRKERDKNKKLKSVCSNREASTWNSEAAILDHPKTVISHRCERAAGHVTSVNSIAKQKDIGIQTDKVDEDESAHASTSGATSTYFGNPELLSIWSSESCNRPTRNFAAKLLEMCATDFCFLFRFLSPNMTSKVEMKHLPLAAFPGDVHGLHSAGVNKISQLYSVLAQLNGDMVYVDALVEILLDLCSLENALVVRRSLHILHVAVDYLLSIDRRHPKRDNIKVERCHSESDAVHSRDSAARKRSGINDVIEADASISHYTTGCKHVGIPEHENKPLLCHVDWFHLFESIRQIAVRLTEEHARMEAVSIMNVILMTTDAYSDREKLGGTCVFEAVALLLRKEAGLFCRKEAVHLLFLLLNCPNILRTFCSSRVAEDHAESPDQGAKNSSLQVSCGILEGLAGCIVGCEHGVKELILCRSAIIVLAFLASSGKLGLEIFLFHKLSKRTNFLGLILQVLLSEADVDAFESCPAPELCKERTLLLREALILLNRLASQPAYSAAFSQALTSCRDMVSLAIEVANRLSKKSRRLLKSDSITRQMRESEVVDLARVFKKRVFSFLGESHS